MPGDASTNSRLRAARYAGALAVAYVVVAGAYILASSRLVAARATSIADLEAAETAKGIGFVLVTALCLFGAGTFLFARLGRRSAQLEEHRRALAKSEQRATAGLLAASIAHDLNNALTVLSMGVAELRHDANVSSELMHDMQEALQRVQGLVRRLSTVGRASPDDRPERTDLVALAERAVAITTKQRERRASRVSVVADVPLQASVHVLLMHQLINNLVLNALDATAPDGSVEVRLRAEESVAILEVHDSGPGIPVTDRERVFEPFFTTKATGTGLGLVSVRVCAELHGGRVSVHESPLGGACFQVRLPSAREPTESSAG